MIAALTVEWRGLVGHRKKGTWKKASSQKKNEGDSLRGLRSGIAVAVIQRSTAFAAAGTGSSSPKKVSGNGKKVTCKGEKKRLRRKSEVQGENPT